MVSPSAGLFVYFREKRERSGTFFRYGLIHNGKYFARSYKERAKPMFHSRTIIIKNAITVYNMVTANINSNFILKSAT